MVLHSVYLILFCFLWSCHFDLQTQKIALAKASAFFNEIRLRRVKYGFAMWNSDAVKYLLRKCEIFADANVGKFHFTSNEVRYFTMCDSTLFHIRQRRIFHYSSFSLIPSRSYLRITFTPCGVIFLFSLRENIIPHLCGHKTMLCFAQMMLPFGQINVGWWLAAAEMNNLGKSSTL